MAREFYVRSPDSETARGPYTLEKLQSLGEAGQISPETYYYDDDREVWLAFRANPELQGEVFPQRKKLTLRKKESEKTPESKEGGDAESEKDEEEEEEETRGPDVAEMLAAAEGETEETRYVKEQARWAEKTAAMIPNFLGAALLVSALSLIYPSWTIVSGLLEAGDEADYYILLRRPLVILGALDLLFGLMLFLGQTSLFPLVRMRAMLGLGYFGFLGYAQFTNGDPQGLILLGSAFAVGLGLFFLTITLRFGQALAAGLAAVCGALAYAYLSLSPLIQEITE
jgi:hypothetical protein